MDPDAHKGRVADVALGRLQSYGFAHTTLEDVARAVDLDEADLRQLFGDTEGLMRELVSPLVARLREIAAAAAAADLRQAEQLRIVVEGYLDALVAHRSLVGVVLGDPTAVESGSVRLVREALLGVRHELADGTGSGLDRRIRAAAAMGAVQVAALELADIETAIVRDVITDAAVAILLP